MEKASQENIIKTQKVYSLGRTLESTFQSHSYLYGKINEDESIEIAKDESISLIYISTSPLTVKTEREDGEVDVFVWNRDGIYVNLIDVREGSEVDAYTVIYSDTVSHMKDDLLSRKNPFIPMTFFGVSDLYGAGDVKPDVFAGEYIDMVIPMDVLDPFDILNFEEFTVVTFADCNAQEGKELLKIKGNNVISILLNMDPDTVSLKYQVIKDVMLANTRHLHDMGEEAFASIKKAYGDADVIFMEGLLSSEGILDFSFGEFGGNAYTAYILDVMHLADSFGK